MTSISFKKLMLASALGLTSLVVTSAITWASCSFEDDKQINQSPRSQVDTVPDIEIQQPIANSQPPAISNAAEDVKDENRLVTVSRPYDGYFGWFWSKPIVEDISYKDVGAYLSKYPGSCKVTYTESATENTEDSDDQSPVPPFVIFDLGRSVDRSPVNTDKDIAFERETKKEVELKTIKPRTAADALATALKAQQRAQKNKTSLNDTELTASVTYTGNDAEEFINVYNAVNVFYKEIPVDQASLGSFQTIDLKKVAIYPEFKYCLNIYSGRNNKNKRKVRLTGTDLIKKIESAEIDGTKLDIIEVQNSDGIKLYP